jgi:hypothetical protein
VVSCLPLVFTVVLIDVAVGFLAKDFDMPISGQTHHFRKPRSALSFVM